MRRRAAGGWGPVECRFLRPRSAASSWAERAPPNERTPEAVGSGPCSWQGHGSLPPEPLLLELHRGQVAQRRMDPLPVVHGVQEPTQLAVGIGEVPVLGQVDLLLADG